jgi:4-diphosphocytidyl-2-C-methyl-D-erythritol kinase
MHGAGEHVERLPDPEPFGLVILPSPHALSTPEVYRAFDGIGPGRSPDELEREAAAARAGAPPPPVNDLQAAAVALCPPIEQALASLRAAGAAQAMVSGSGPTVFGLFATPAAAEAAAAALPGAVATVPVGAEFARVRAA